MAFAQIGPQLPPDSTGKVTGAFPVTITIAGGASQTIYVPSTVIVNADGQEIGQTLLNAFADTNELLGRCLNALALIAGELTYLNPDELLVGPAAD